MRHTVRMTSHSAIGKRIREQRIRKGFSSQEALADAAKSSTRMVAQAEAGQTVGAKTVLRLDDALGWRKGHGIDALHRGEEPQEATGIHPALHLPEDAQLADLRQRAKQISAQFALINDVYDKFGPDMAREATRRLASDFAELQAQLDDLLPSGKTEQNQADG